MSDNIRIAAYRYTASQSFGKRNQKIHYQEEPPTADNRKVDMIGRLEKLVLLDDALALQARIDELEDKLAATLKARGPEDNNADFLVSNFREGKAVSVKPSSSLSQLQGLPSLHARFTAQASIAGHLMDVDPEGADLVDITAECIEKGREWALSLGDEPDSLDHLKESGGTPGWARDWPAPYRFDPPSDQEINHFFDEYEKALQLQERKRSNAECDGPSP